MTRAFVAIDVPEQLRSSIVQHQPRRSRHVRPVSANQLHLTLHFLGDVDATAAIEALKMTQGKSFTLQLNRAGHFSGRDGGRILWLGLADSPALLELHQQIGARLSKRGFSLEKRKFHPHITVARLKATAASELVHHFQQRVPTWLPLSFEVNEFTLYASELTSQGPSYEKLLCVELSNS